MRQTMHCLIFTSCTKTKDDSVRDEALKLVARPEDYLDDPDLARFLEETRRSILSRPEAQRGSRAVPAFDLYVRAGRMYSALRRSDLYNLIRQALQGRESELQWFFLSGGYGLVHALEPATSYQATFDYHIAHKEGIPYTGKIWGARLGEICNQVIETHRGWPVYVFGTREYTQFVKATRRWVSGEAVKVLEGTGSGGSSWLSRKLLEFARDLLAGRLEDFDRRYPQVFFKQAQ